MRLTRGRADRRLTCCALLLLAAAGCEQSATNTFAPCAREGAPRFGTCEPSDAEPDGARPDRGQQTADVAVDPIPDPAVPDPAIGDPAPDPIVDPALTSAAASSPDLTGGSTVPLMGFAEVDDAWEARGAAIGAWGVGFDAPSGPGHDGMNQPCAECGRGVVGIGAPDPSFGHPEPPQTPLAEISWDDGSTAWISYRILDPRLPIDAALMPSSDGQLLPDGLQATLVIDGDVYQVWSHLGLDHLISLLTQLRYVAG